MIEKAEYQKNRELYDQWFELSGKLLKTIPKNRYGSQVVTAMRKFSFGLNSGEAFMTRDEIRQKHREKPKDMGGQHNEHNKHKTQ